MTRHTKAQPGRRLAAAAAFTTAALLMSGCTPSAQQGGGAGGETGGDGDQTLTVWHYFSDDNQVAIMEDYKELFESNNEGVTVENVFVPYDQMNPRLVSSAASGTGPDIAVFNGADTSTLALADALLPLDDYWGDFADAGQFPDSVIHRLEDSVYSVQGYVNLLGLWYNAEILEEIGVEPPTTMDELNAAMDAAVEAGHVGMTLSGLPNSQGEWQAYPWLTAFGFDYADPQAEPLIEAFTQIEEWTESGAVPQEAVTWDQTVPFQTFAAGGVAFAENGNWQQGTAASTAEFEYGVVPLPVGAEGQVYLGGEGQGIGAFSENPDLAWDYLEQTYFSTEGGVIAAERVGSIPARTDAAADEAVTGNELLEPFAQAIAENGANYPSPAVPAESVADQQLEVGQIWSSVIGGQLTPEDAAEQMLEVLEPLL